jgi:hypothetical protein
VLNDIEEAFLHYDFADQLNHIILHDEVSRLSKSVVLGRLHLTELVFSLLRWRRND